jgi:hypothetical protein
MSVYMNVVIFDFLLQVFASPEKAMPLILNRYATTELADRYSALLR